MELEILLEVFQPAGQRRHGPRRQRAEGAARPHILHMPLQHPQILDGAFALLQVAEYLLHPGQAVPTGGAPAAGLMGEEPHQIADHPHRAGLVVEHDQGAGGQAAADLLHLGVIQRHIQMARQHELGGAAPRQKTLQLQPHLHTAGFVFKQFTHGGAQRQFPAAGALHLAADPEQFGAVILAAGEALIPLHPVGDDARQVAQGLHIVDDGGPAPEAAHLRIGRLGAGVGALAFKGVEQGRLLAADVTAGAGVEHDVQVVAGAEDVLAQITFGVGLFDGPF